MGPGVAMCITAAAKVVAIDGNRATVELSGKREVVRIDLVDVKVGDRVFCAAGMAIERA